MRLIAVGVAAALIATAGACASATPASSSGTPNTIASSTALAVPADVARAGTIVVGFTPNPAIVSNRDADGTPHGVAPDLITALAARMGVNVTWKAFELFNAPVVQNVQSGAWDLLLLSPDSAGADVFDFVGYLEIDHALLVPSGSTIKSFADADKAGVKIWVFKGAPVERTLTRAVKSATVVVRDWPTLAAFNADIQAGGWDAYAQNRQSLLQLTEQVKGSRVLPDRFGSTVQSIGVKRGRAELLAYVTAFVAEVKSTGLIKKSIETFKVQGVQPAQ